MEDILASIRRILNDGDADTGRTGSAAPDVASPASTATSAPTNETDDTDDVFLLDQAMIIEDEPPPVAPAFSAADFQAAMDEFDRPSSPASTPPLPTPQASASPPSRPPAEPHQPSPRPDAGTRTDDDVFNPPPLVAPETQAAASGSIGTLVRALLERQVPVARGSTITLEDLVRDEMRPLVKTWLDEHLPPMVERLVRAEIERVVGRAIG